MLPSQSDKIQRLTKDDLHQINSVRDENRSALTSLRLEMQDKMTAHATLQDIQQHQALLDRNDLFNLLGDRYVLTPDVVAEGADILAYWREYPSLIDEMDLQQTVDLLADLLYLNKGYPQAAISA